MPLYRVGTGRTNDLIGQLFPTRLVMMKTVSVSELKAQLSRYLRHVAKGGEVQVIDRGVPIARLTSIAGKPDDDTERRHRLARSGVLRLGNGGIDKILRSRPAKLPTSISDALREDREDRT